MTKTLFAGAALAALFAMNAPVAQAHVASQWMLQGTSMQGGPWEIQEYPNKSSCEAGLSIGGGGGRKMVAVTTSGQRLNGWGLEVAREFIADHTGGEIQTETAGRHRDGRDSRPPR